MDLALIRDLGILAMGGTIITKIIWDWLKNRNGKNDKIYVCPLDKSAMADIIAEIKNKNNVIHEDIKDMRTDLRAGIKVAERNTQHYEDFVRSLTVLNTSSAQTLDILKTLTASIQRQTELLVQMNGRK